MHKRWINRQMNNKQMNGWIIKLKSWIIKKKKKGLKEEFVDYFSCGKHREKVLSVTLS